ncbi:MAG: FAD-binding protein [Gemmataceae bacterium]
MPVLSPESVSALQEIVRQAGRDDTPLFPLGGATHLTLGNPPARHGKIVGCGALDRVIDYPARDMTITVQAGITIARLQEILAAEKQRLPIDVPDAAHATLGGTLAANVSGPRRLGFGTLRDYVIGISAVNDAGDEFKAGGRVVKNVAGYDMCKLLVGSLGTLGIVTQVTLKLRPRPESSRLVLLAASSASLTEALDRLHGTRTRPVAVELLGGEDEFDLPGSVGPTDWRIAVGFEGNAETVDWQTKRLIEEWAGAASLLDADESATAWHVLVDSVMRESSPCHFKASLPASGVGRFCVDHRKPGWLLQAQAASGIVWGYGRPGLTLEEAGTMLTSWRGAAASAGGSVVVVRCPPEWKNALNVWGPPPENAWLLREVKRKFDPRGLFNPGRFVAGI